MVEECYDNGRAIMIMPYGSQVAKKYAKEAPEVEELLMHPTVGWISGFDLKPEERQGYMTVRREKPLRTRL